MSRDDLADRITGFLQESGIDPIYFATLVCILITVSYWNDFKNWEKLPGWNKGLVASAVFATMVLSTISLLRIVGVIKF